MGWKLSSSLKNILTKRNKINKKQLRTNHQLKKVRKINNQQQKVIKKEGIIGTNNHLMKTVHFYHISHQLSDHKWAITHNHQIWTIIIT